MNRRQKLQHLIDYGGDDIEVDRRTNTLYRVGYCSRCGACCKTISISSRVGDNTAEWLKGYGVQISLKEDIYESPDESDRYEHSATLTFPITCKFLNKEGNLHTCRRYKQRPVICKLYPRLPSRWPSCTFVFLNDKDLQWFLAEWRKKYGEDKKIKFIQS